MESDDSWIAKNHDNKEDLTKIVKMALDRPKETYYFIGSQMPSRLIDGNEGEAPCQIVSEERARELLDRVVSSFGTAEVYSFHHDDANETEFRVEFKSGSDPLASVITIYKRIVENSFYLGSITASMIFNGEVGKQKFKLYTPSVGNGSDEMKRWSCLLVRSHHRRMLQKIQAMEEWVNDEEDVLSS